MTDAKTVDEKPWYPANPSDRWGLEVHIDAATDIIPDLCRVISGYVYHPDTLLPCTLPDHRTKLPCKEFKCTKHIELCDFVGRTRFEHGDTKSIELTVQPRECPVSQFAMCEHCCLHAVRITLLNVMRQEKPYTFHHRLAASPFTLVAASNTVCTIDEAHNRLLLIRDYGTMSDGRSRFFVVHVVHVDPLFFKAFRVYSKLLPVYEARLEEEALATVAEAQEVLKVYEASQRNAPANPVA
jgi:hypothetical protein